MEITTDHLSSLADKLDGLDLTDEEQAILDTVFGRSAAAGEVEGFVMGIYARNDITRGVYKGMVVETTPLTPTAQRIFDIFTEVSVREPGN